MQKKDTFNTYKNNKLNLTFLVLIFTLFFVLSCGKKSDPQRPIKQSSIIEK